jgi:penicillin-binding protein 1A
MEMVRAYTAFANLGKYQPLRPIIKVETDNGETLIEFEIPEKVEALSEDTAEIMSNLLINVVEHGTGRKALKIKRVIGGKTGTTNDYKDAWFMGVMPNIVTGTWVGFDDFKSIGRLETGSRAALPAWLNYTEQIIDKFDYALFPVSGKVTYYKVDNETFQITEAFNKNFKFEPFADDSVNNILNVTE